MTSFKHALQVLAGTLTVVAGGAIAGPVPVFNQPIDFSSPACATYGDFISCSGQYLNYLVYGSPSGPNNSTNYVVQSPQGLLQDALVVFTGGQAAVNNTDIGPNIDNAYRALITNETIYGTSIGAGENPPGAGIIDPSTLVIGEVSGAISGINGGGAGATAWDIGLSSLIDALTVDGIRRDLLIFFDNNQVGVTEGQNLLISGLVCVQDNALVNPLPDRCFELVDQNGTFNPAPNPTIFNTILNYGDPLATSLTDLDYPTGGPVLANGTFCVSTSTKQVVAFNVVSAAACPAGSVFINNNLGTNQTEFIASIPELNAQLEAFLAAGYDLVSTQLLFQNQNGGFEDVFLLAGAPRTPSVVVPEPGTIVLLGLGLLALVGVRRLQRKF